MNKKTSKTKSIASTESWSRDPKNGRREKLSKTCKLVGFLDLQVEVKMKSAHGIFSFFQKEKVRGRNKTKKKKRRKFRDWKSSRLKYPSIRRYTNSFDWLFLALIKRISRLKEIGRIAKWSSRQSKMRWTGRSEPDGDGNFVKKRGKYRVIFLLEDSKSMPRDIVIYRVTHLNL